MNRISVHGGAAHDRDPEPSQPGQSSFSVQMNGHSSLSVQTAPLPSQSGQGPEPGRVTAGVRSARCRPARRRRSHRRRSSRLRRWGAGFARCRPPQRSRRAGRISHRCFFLCAADHGMRDTGRLAGGEAATTPPALRRLVRLRAAGVADPALNAGLRLVIGGGGGDDLGPGVIADAVDAGGVPSSDGSECLPMAGPSFVLLITGSQGQGTRGGQRQPPAPGDLPGLVDPALKLAHQARSTSASVAKVSLSTSLYCSAPALSIFSCLPAPEPSLRASVSSSLRFRFPNMDCSVMLLINGMRD